MKYLFAIVCHNFNLRLVWQLSSILQQREAPEIVIDLATTGDGEPDIYNIVDNFDLDIKPRYYLGDERDRFAYRGYVRNDQIIRAAYMKCDYIFFADCDNVYSPDFFKLLDKTIMENPHIDKCIFSAEKYHTETDATDKMVLLAEKVPVIDDAYTRALSIPKIAKSNKPVAAGCMQVCNVREIFKKTGGYYVPEGKTRDKNLFEKGQRARSDIQFRRKMGGGSRIKLPHQVHLNHIRDKEAGTHLEVMR